MKETEVREQVIEKMKEIYEMIKEKRNESEWIKENARVGLRKKRNDSNGICRESLFENIEEYIYLTVDEKISIIMTNDFNLIPKDLLWEVATENSKRDISIKSIFKALKGISDSLGTPMPELPEIPEEEFPLYVVESSGRAFFDKETIRSALNTNRVIVIPSSNKEILIQPCGEVSADELNYMNDTVRSVNETLTPEEVLGDRAYVVDLK